MTVRARERPIEPKAISEEALFAAHWHAHGR